MLGLCGAGVRMGSHECWANILPSELHPLPGAGGSFRSKGEMAVVAKNLEPLDWN